MNKFFISLLSLLALSACKKAPPEDCGLCLPPWENKYEMTGSIKLNNTVVAFERLHFNDNHERKGLGLYKDIGGQTALEMALENMLVNDTTYFTDSISTWPYVRLHNVHGDAYLCWLSERPHKTGYVYLSTTDSINYAIKAQTYVVPNPPSITTCSILGQLEDKVAIDVDIMLTKK